MKLRAIATCHSRESLLGAIFHIPWFTPFMVCYIECGAAMDGHGQPCTVTRLLNPLRPPNIGNHFTSSTQFWALNLLPLMGRTWCQIELVWACRCKQAEPQELCVSRDVSKMHMAEGACPICWEISIFPAKGQRSFLIFFYQTISMNHHITKTAKEVLWDFLTVIGPLTLFWRVPKWAKFMVHK